MATNTQIESVTFLSPETDGAEIGGDLVGVGTTSSPALILIPDVHGISPLYRTLGERLAAAGFRTLVLDIYAREGAPHLADMAQVGEWIANLPDERVLGDVAAARVYLASRADVTESAIGILGFCLGGQYALMAACRLPQITACASFYGMLRYAERSERKPASALDMAPQLSCPLVGLYGADDSLIPTADVSELRDILERGGKEFDLVTYEGAGHAFLNEARPEAYRPEAAADAWERALKLFQKYLS
ncbi:MAG: dienelactone hydrolase family protein [Candidatus Binatia bacterium]|nr:dienelactone hydrolase family protein [Candidatus Binatia bacterium]